MIYLEHFSLTVYVLGPALSFQSCRVGFSKLCMTRPPLYQQIPDKDPPLLLTQRTNLVPCVHSFSYILKSIFDIPYAHIPHCT